MQWTGNVARTFGHVLLALGAIALVLGVAGLVVGGLVVKDAQANPQAPHDDLGDFLAVLVEGGLALIAFGTLGVVAGIISLGIGRGLRERLQRRLSKTTAPAARDAESA